MQLGDDAGALGLRQAVERHVDGLRDRLEQLLHEAVHVRLKMLRRDGCRVLRLHGLLGGRVDREVVVMDKIVRVDELENGVADLVEPAVVKIDAQQADQLAAVLDKHRARTDGLSVCKLSGVVQIIVARLVLLLHDHAQRRVCDRRADAAAADGAVGNGGHAAGFRQDLMQYDLIIRPKRCAEVFDQHGILPKHLFRHRASSL